jgi:hypothetical protein
VSLQTFRVTYVEGEGFTLSASAPGLIKDGELPGRLSDSLESANPNVAEGNGSKGVEVDQPADSP